MKLTADPAPPRRPPRRRARVNAAGAHALAFELLKVRRVERIVSAALEREPAPAARSAVVALPARCARPPQRFAHHPQKEDAHGTDR